MGAGALTFVEGQVDNQPEIYLLPFYLPKLPSSLREFKPFLDEKKPKSFSPRRITLTVEQIKIFLSFFALEKIEFFSIFSSSKISRRKAGREKVIKNAAKNSAFLCEKERKERGCRMLPSGSGAGPAFFILGEKNVGD